MSDRSTDDLGAAQGSPSARWHSLDAIVAVGLVVAFVVRFQAGSETWFFADDFPLAARQLDFDGLLRPYNGHLSTTLVVVYQGALPLSGLRSFTLLRVISLLAATALPAALYLRARNPLGAPVAAVAASLFVWTFPASWVAQQLAYVLVLAAGCVLAGALARSDRRSDLLVALVLSFGLVTSAVGAILAGVAVVHSLLRRADRSRWLAVAVPFAAWFGWWVLLGRQAEQLSEPVGLGDSLQLAGGGVIASFETVALGNRIGGVLVGVAFVVHLGWRVWTRRGAQAAAWAAGLAAWWVILIQSRGALAEADVTRYRLVGAVFVVLSLVPEEAVRWPTLPGLRLEPPAAGRPGWLGAGGAVLGLVAVTLLALPSYLDARDFEVLFAKVVRQQVVVARLQPPVLPGDEPLPLWMGYQTPDELERLAERWGFPDEGTSPEAVDRVLARQSEFSPAAPEASPACSKGDDRITTAGGDATIRLVAGSSGASVSMLRFGSEFQPVGRIGANGNATLSLRSSLAGTPWVVRIEGGCARP